MTVVVTGLGALTPLGPDVEALRQGLLAGRSGVRLLEDPEFAGLPTRLAATVDATGRLDRVKARTMSRVQQLALIAAREAWQSAGSPTVDADRLAVVVGTGVGGVQVVPPQIDVLRQSGPRHINPYFMTSLMTNAAAAAVGLDLGARGGVHTVVSACASGSEAVAAGLDLIASGRVDVVVAGGAEACIHPLTLGGFAQLRALSLMEDDPGGASRPFDRSRDGFVLGEGAGMLVLEAADHARARGAQVQALLLGAGVCSDAFHMVAPDPSGAGAARSITMALQRAGLVAGDIGHVNTHGTSTRAGDLAESRALTSALRGHRPAATANKACTGHMLGAAGAVEAVATVMALRDGCVPAVRNLDDTDPGVDLDLVRGGPRLLDSAAALSTSFGFGGHDVCLAFGRA